MLTKASWSKTVAFQTRNPMHRAHEELCKMAQGFAEQGRIGIRASRKEAMDALKLAQKNGMPEDDFKRSEKEVQKTTDDSVGQINQALSSKEADLRQV